MHVPRLHPIKALLAVGILATSLAGCGSDDPVAPGEGLVGTWEVTRFQAAGFPNFIDAGMSLTVTLTASTYTFAVANDAAELCDGATSCTDSGTYTATDTQITLDAGTEDEETFSYTVQGSAMTWTGVIDGIALTVEMRRV